MVSLHLLFFQNVYYIYFSSAVAVPPFLYLSHTLYVLYLCSTPIFFRPRTMNKTIDFVDFFGGRARGKIEIK